MGIWHSGHGRFSAMGKDMARGEAQSITLICFNVVWNTTLIIAKLLKLSLLQVPPLSSLLLACQVMKPSIDRSTRLV